MRVRENGEAHWIKPKEKMSFRDLVAQHREELKALLESIP